jgi:hypothetical protein
VRVKFGCGDVIIEPRYPRATPGERLRLRLLTKVLIAHGVCCAQQKYFLQGLHDLNVSELIGSSMFADMLGQVAATGALPAMAMHRVGPCTNMPGLESAVTSSMSVLLSYLLAVHFQSCSRDPLFVNVLCAERYAAHKETIC